MPIPEYVRSIRDKIGHDLLMMPTVTAVILNAAGHVLLQQRSDNSHWGVPGGIMEPGEEPAEALIREVYEETGLTVIPVRVTGVYAGPSNIGAYPNGDQYAMVNMTFRCRAVGGALRTDQDETLALQYFPPDALPANLLDRHRIRIAHALSRSSPYFARPATSER